MDMKAIQFRRILCPINFAHGSQRTVEGAAILAAMYSAELRLFHVVSNGDRGRDAKNRDAESLIASLFALTRTLPERTRASAALAFGDPSAEIVQHARLMGSDLIVLGTERRLTPAQVRRSIVADVAAHAPCPVLHVRPHLLLSLSDTIRGFSEIVCCVDPVAGSLEGGDYAHALARHGHARVTLLNVLATDDDTSDLTREAAEETDCRRDVVHVSLTGSPESEIVALAERIGADLIVMGAQDEASAEQRLGSTTAHVMVHAPCAVLIVSRSSNAFHMTSNNASIGETKGVSQ
jgi:nucleotide-binding universal stress UspA family protein